MHVGIQQINATGGGIEAQVGRPHAKGGLNASQIQFLGGVENVVQELPMDKITRMIQRTAWEPFKAGSGHVIVFPDADDAGIAMKARQHGVVNESQRESSFLT